MLGRRTFCNNPVATDVLEKQRSKANEPLDSAPWWHTSWKRRSAVNLDKFWYRDIYGYDVEYIRIYTLYTVIYIWSVSDHMIGEMYIQRLCSHACSFILQIAHVLKIMPALIALLREASGFHSISLYVDLATFSAGASGSSTSQRYIQNQAVVHPKAAINEKNTCQFYRIGIQLNQIYII